MNATLIKVGQVVKFHTPLADESPDQTYSILEVKGDRVEILALKTGLVYPPISTVMAADLIAVN